jgi:hypothetical protein
MSFQRPGLCFQRPGLYGFNNPATFKSPLHDVHTFALEMMYNCTTLADIKSFLSLPIFVRRNIIDYLISDFQSTLKMHSLDDPHDLIKEMGNEDYLTMLDSEFDDEADRDK